MGKNYQPQLVSLYTGFLNHPQYAYMIQPLEIRDWTLENGGVNEAA